MCGNQSSFSWDIFLRWCHTIDNLWSHSLCRPEKPAYNSPSWNNSFPMIIKTTKQVWVTISRRVAKIAKPIPIHEKVSKIAEDQITTLYPPDELQSWKDYNSFPSFIKSSYQKILDSLCVMKEFASSSSNMLGRVMYKLEGQNWMISTPWELSQGSSTWSRSLFWLASHLSILPLWYPVI